MRRNVMREFDDNPHSYGPVLRRIGILVAVVIAVPIMLWTITSFMRTYVAQPVIASPKPLPAPTTTASIGTANAGIASGNTDSSAPAQQIASFASRTTANDGNPPSAAAKVASLATTDMPAPMPAGGPPQPADAAAATQQASSPWPDPNQAIGGQQISSADAATAATDDALPPSAPLTGPIPLPPHRPAVIAMATAGAPGAVPLPRARPAETGAPAETTESSGNFLSHLFGQTH